MNISLGRIRNSIVYRAQNLVKTIRHPGPWSIYQRLRGFTMIPKYIYMDNIRLACCYSHVPGAIVECGTWRGGMIAGLAMALGPDRMYYLLDSFEGLPKAREIDGQDAIKWQNDKRSPFYFDNCTADIEYARKAMAQSGAKKVEILKGWFKDTLPHMPEDTQIAILRLDGDWYDSTMECLERLFPMVADGGITVIDDYSAWSGCRKAVHDYLSKNNINACIYQFENAVTYIVKKPQSTP